MIARVWLKFFLYRIAKRFPDFFEQFLDDINTTQKQKLIMRYRYQQLKGWKEIPDMKGINLEQRQVERLHKEVIDKILRL